MAVIKINDEIGWWGITAKSIKEQLDDATGDITIEIASPGGSVFEGIAIFNAIKAYDKGAVTTVIDSIAASMASYIALAGSHIKAHANSVYMIHNASTVSWGDARQLRKDAQHIDSLTALLKKEYVKRSGKSEDEITQMLNDETYLYGSEILDNRFCDEIIGIDEDNDAVAAKALAFESVKACISHYKEKAKEDENAQVAALLKTSLGENPASAQITNQTQGDSMGNTYTQQDVQALEAQHAEAMQTAISEAVSNERERAAGIMALGASASFTEKALNDGLSVGDAAIALLKQRDADMKQRKDEFKTVAQEIDDIDVDDIDDEPTSQDAKAEKEADEALNSIFGGNK